MKGKLYIHFSVEFSDSLNPEQCKALEAVLPPKPASQYTDMELDECEETMPYDVNIEEELRRRQQQHQEAYDEDDEMPESAAGRIRALAGPPSALPEWESDDGWIEVCGGCSELSDAAVGGQEVKFPSEQCEFPSTAVAASSEQVHSEVHDVPSVAAPAAETTSYGNFWGGESEAELETEPFGADLDVGDDPVHNVGAGDAYAHQQQLDFYVNFTSNPIVLHLGISEEITKTSFHSQIAPFSLPPPPQFVF